MKILVIGSGGREHALAQKFLESSLVETVYCAPGNAGMISSGLQIVPISELDNEALLEFAQKHKIDLTFVGPETALVNGVVDAFQRSGLKIFGPTAAAAAIEGSKNFAKSLMKKYDIPTADYATFDKLDEALAYVHKHGAPIVVKVDGLAAGKGVTVAQTISQAVVALEEIYDADSEAKVVIEEFLKGEEFSLFSFVHAGKVYPMPLAQDHKRAYDGDKGPNTGGMGAYSPLSHLPKTVTTEALEKIVKPTVASLRAEGYDFTGILYAGLILTKQGVKTIEFNARFGDPETQVVLPRLKSDLAAAILALLDNREPELAWCSDDITTLGVVVAAEGYPKAAIKNLKLPKMPTDSQVYYAGVAENEQNQLISDGGRVFMLVESADSIKKAQRQVYEKLNQLDLTSFFYRHDIGNRALKIDE